jgi:hypothetical protein
MAVIGISYNEGRKNLAYKSVDIRYGAKFDKTKVFDSGDFVKDWYDCNKFIITKLYEKEFHFSNSSSVDNFIMDGAPYRSAYLKTTETTAELVYEHDFNDRGIEFFVKKGTKPTWNELRVLCGDPIKALKKKTPKK